MTDWQDAVRQTAEGAVLEVEVVPGAARAEFPAGYNPWRNRIEARVPAPPVEGRANLALLQLIADFFELPLRSVRLVSGETSRQKRVLVVGLTREEALRRLTR
jgi:uncharacterized protein